MTAMAKKIPTSRIVEVPCTFFKRCLAFLIDMLILDLVAFAPLTGIFEKLVPTSPTMAGLESNIDLVNSLFWLFLYVSIVIIIYFSMLEFKFGQTLGKMVVGIHIKSTDNIPLTFGRVIFSNLLFLPIFPFVLLWIIEPIYLLFTNQRLLEKFSKIQLVQQVFI